MNELIKADNTKTQKTSKWARVPKEYALNLTLPGLELPPKDSTKSQKEFDWDDFYRQGTPSWDTGELEPDFKQVVDGLNLKTRTTVLDIGCGSGIEALYMAQKRFEVTAVDCSRMATDRASSRADIRNAQLRIVTDDIFRFTHHNRNQYDFVYDIGFYHFIRQRFLADYIDMLWRITKKGSYYYTLAGASEEGIEREYAEQNFLPSVSQEEVTEELASLFEIVEVRQGTIRSRAKDEPFLAWSCLFRRP